MNTASNSNKMKSTQKEDKIQMKIYDVLFSTQFKKRFNVLDWLGTRNGIIFIIVFIIYSYSAKKIEALDFVIFGTIGLWLYLRDYTFNYEKEKIVPFFIYRSRFFLALYNIREEQIKKKLENKEHKEILEIGKNLYKINKNKKRDKQ